MRRYTESEEEQFEQFEEIVEGMLTLLDGRDVGVVGPAMTAVCRIFCATIGIPKAEFMECLNSAWCEDEIQELH